MMGTVIGWQEGRSMSVARGPDDTLGVTFTIRNASYGEGVVPLRSGTRVIVSYKMVGERWPVAIAIRASR